MTEYEENDFKFVTVKGSGHMVILEQHTVIMHCQAAFHFYRSPSTGL